MDSVMKHNFAQVPKAEIERSTFDRSHGYKTTFDAGYLVPVFVDEALPGDTFNLKMTAFGRLATLLKPPLDNMFLTSFFFAVPYRLVWQNWQKFNGEQKNPGDPTDFEIPTVTPPSPGYPVGSLADYFGIPTDVPGLHVNALPFRAYNLIYNEWFRDQNLINSEIVNVGDGPDSENAYRLLRRGKRHDYFTSGLPWPQKGEQILLPLGSTAPVEPDGTINPRFTNGTNTRDLGFTASNANAQWFDSGAVGAPSSSGEVYWNRTGLKVDLSSATSANINAIREAFQMQRMLERDARGGTRYTEIVRAHFGVVSPDARLQRPEYLGGGTTVINVHPVSQQSPTGTYANTPQANLAAYGTVSANGHGFTKAFTEHCIIIGLICAHADLTYQQGLNRMWSRKTRYDHYWPALSHLGEQAILNKELYAAGLSDPEDDNVFAYQERYAEYRYKPSQVTGLFRSSAATSLDFWHLSQDFATRPALNQAFIEENPPIDRIVAVPTEPHFLFDAYFKLTCARPMPVFGVPGMVDHF